MKKFAGKLFVVLFIYLTFLIPSTKGQVQYFPDSLNTARLSTVITGKSVFYLAGLSYLNFIWYKDEERVPFQWYNDNEGWLQMDKWGHMYAAYYQSYWGYHALRWAGVKEKDALIFGGGLGIVLQTPIEIFDGLYEGYGFSWGDMAANTLGSGLFTVQQAIWRKQWVTMKFSFSPSQYRPYNPSALGETQLASLFMDYNGQTYWLSWDIKGIAGWQNWPDWLQFATGYSGNGMLAEFENPQFDEGKRVPQFRRYRQLLLAPSIDLRKIKTESRFLRRLFQYLNIVKFPLPAMEWNEDGNIRFHPLYF